MTTIEVPDNYGFVVLGCTIVPVFSTFFTGLVVMKARKDFNVQYPNLYATPGFHEQADEFNRVQRGHQHMLESLTSFTAASLLGGLKYPIAVSVFGILYGVGNILYLVGYSDT
jgi:glutathione S-transferase